MVAEGVSGLEAGIGGKTPARGVVSVGIEIFLRGHFAEAILFQRLVRLPVHADKRRGAELTVGGAYAELRTYAPLACIVAVADSGDEAVHPVAHGFVHPVASILGIFVHIPVRSVYDREERSRVRQSAVVGPGCEGTPVAAREVSVTQLELPSTAHAVCGADFSYVVEGHAD